MRRALASFEQDPLPLPLPDDDDLGLTAVEAELRRLDPDGATFARVIRDTLDQIYDGQHTGRWDYAQLYKTEKTHVGTLIEINLQRQFEFSDGEATDYRIANVQVDCKYSMRYGGWELPPESIGHVCLIVTADDSRSSWAAGLIRIQESLLRSRANRDAKRQLAASSYVHIRKLWPGNEQLAENLFMHLDPKTRERIFNARARRGSQHGQAKTNELFRLVQRRIIRRSELATVAQQDDFMKRARGNGGARTMLRPEGILVLGHQDQDPLVADALGLPVPKKGEFVSARVVPAQQGRDDPIALIDNRPWSLARPGDPQVPAPIISRREQSNCDVH